MNYALEFKKFATSQSIFSAVRISLAIVLPSIVLAHFGLLKEYFLFPLATSFIGLTDQAGPFIRRRNALIVATVSFFVVSLIASFLKSFPILIYPEIIIFAIFFTMIGVYGQRLAAVGSLSLVVLGIFIDGHLTGDNIIKSSLIFLAGSICYLCIFLLVSKIQPYKLAGQMIGENYLELANYLSIKSKFYLPKPDYDALYSQIISQQITIKNLQEETRETVFKTRKIVNESTTTSRLLMLMFLNSIDLHEKLMTSESDYRKVQENFGSSGFLKSIGHYLETISHELSNIGIALQSGIKPKPLEDIDSLLEKIFNEYFDLRNRRLNSDNLENFMTLRIILNRITAVSDELNTIYKVFNQDEKLAKSLSTGLDYQKFVTADEKLNSKVLMSNFSLKSSHFRHAIRIAFALVVGYFISKLEFLGIGHSYWIFITIVAILKPAYATTKHRNVLRLYGTVAGAVCAYAILYFIPNQTVLFVFFLLTMILCFAFLKTKYSWAVFFMTIYVFLAFNILNPGNLNVIFKDRVLDTIIAGIVAFAVSYFVFPVWEHTKNLDFMKKSATSNLNYFSSAMDFFKEKNFSSQDYKLSRKAAIIDLANLSDNFQRMISDPKNQQKKLEHLHQFVITSHLITAYIASFSQYFEPNKKYSEIDFDSWDLKISAELLRTKSLLNQKNLEENIKLESQIQPLDSVERLLENRRKELHENEFFDRRDPNRITYLTELKNLKEILELIYDVAKEQRKVAEKLQPEIQSTIVKQ
ncbi:FUSC family protein [Chryseobacterium sp. SNU WT5]|uniref:FUSC family protein n=1 Tax=Chryseobacterium sp. SNU WT5 TaxID=2594269 RepID=UPI00117DBACF|nr:FUSC family membrane protein [Chryseobacterium sp. SNU WT5]QDP86174.1 FUSC family protein [Chryseobacterium sp. SNU WT5]